MKEEERKVILITSMFRSEEKWRYFEAKLFFYPYNFIIRITIFTIHNSNTNSLTKYNDIYHS